jgi:BirA family biotin operon repressor/biotin-[acetyl-CoA-carboxylase] ligase
MLIFYLSYLYCAPKIAFKNGFKNLFPIHFKYHFINQVNSTNNYIKNLNAENGLVVYTAHQTAGRGMASNTWESKPNKNLLCSILLEFHFVKIEHQAYINMAISIALQTVIKNITQKNCFIKWPNDIYIENKKIAGILIENAIQGTVLKQTIIGFGLNVNQMVFENKNAISLKNILNHDLEIEAILHQLTNEINIVYQTLKQSNYNEIAEYYNQLLYRKNENCQFIVNNKICQGTIVNVNNYGLLQVKIDNKLLEFAHKEIAMINVG